jgi:hypothetical protein
VHELCCTTHSVDSFDKTRHHARMHRAVIVLFVVVGCSNQPILRSGGTPATQQDQIDVVDDPKIEYRENASGFPIPADAVANGSTFVVPRGFHQTARMQSAKLTELGFKVESSRPAANAYELHVQKGSKQFVATITSPRGAQDNESSTLAITEAPAH